MLILYCGSFVTNSSKAVNKNFPLRPTMRLQKSAEPRGKDGRAFSAAQNGNGPDRFFRQCRGLKISRKFLLTSAEPGATENFNTEHQRHVPLCSRHRFFVRRRFQPVFFCVLYRSLWSGTSLTSVVRKFKGPQAYRRRPFFISAACGLAAKPGSKQKGAHHVPRQESPSGTHLQPS